MRPSRSALGLFSRQHSLGEGRGGEGCLKEAVVPVKGGGDESLVQFGGSGTGGGYDGVAASAQSWIREAGENLRKQA